MSVFPFHIGGGTFEQARSSSTANLRVARLSQMLIAEGAGQFARGEPGRCTPPTRWG